MIVSVTQAILAILFACKLSGCAADDLLLNRVPSINPLDFFNNFLNNGIIEDQKLLGNSSTNATILCYNHLQQINSGIRNKEIWAIKFLDAWGKFPAGLLQGHLSELGSFDECLGISNESISGKYCRAKIPLKQSFMVPLSVEIGICIPDSCQTSDIDPLLNSAITKFLDIKINSSLLNEKRCVVRQDDPFRTIDWVAICVFSLIGIAVLLATIYDYQISASGRVLCPVFLAFSLRVNVKTLFRLTSAKDSPNVINCLNGIRFFSIAWVIYGHSYLMFPRMPVINFADGPEWRHRIFSMIIQNGVLSVDTFFFLSGLLLVLVAMRQMEKYSGKINIPLMYAHRYVRLTPVVALSILFYVSLYRYMSNGPYWNEFVGPTKICNEYWWETLLYIQNYANPYNMCLGHSWYLAVDMQLYIISPLVLIALWKWKRKGLIMLLAIGFLLSVALFVIILVGDLNVLFVLAISQKDEMRKIYISTHSRASPWIIGAAFGYILYCRKGRKAVMAKQFIYLCWVITIITMIACIYAPYPTTYPGARPFTALESAFYLTLSRMLWPIGLAWIIFSCINGYAPVINEFLSWQYWQPFSKLSYCMYISHIFVQTINLGGTKSNLYFSDYNALLKYYGEFVVTLFVSILMFVSIEMPMASIGRILLMPPQHAATNSKQNLSERPTDNV